MWLPRQTGLAIDLASGQAYPVRFERAGRGPAWEVRSSRIFSGSREDALTEVGASHEYTCVVPSLLLFVKRHRLVSQKSQKPRCVRDGIARSVASIIVRCMPQPRLIVFLRLPRLLSPSLREKTIVFCVRTQIYDSRADSIVVPPFPVVVEPRWLVQMLVLPDRELLAQTSTSPEAEEERFVEDIRAQFSFVLAHSGADGRAWFENVFGAGRGKPLVFRRGEAAAAAATVAVAPGTVKIHGP